MRLHGFTIAVCMGLVMVVAFCHEVLAEEPVVTNSMSQSALEETIHNYILAHPEVIAESLRTMEVRQQEAESRNTQQNIVAHQADLLHDQLSPASGNPVGDVTVIEFFDYRCGFCKQVAAAVTQLQKEDTNIRVVYKDFPILGELSVLAAKAALSAHRQGKHRQFHEALLASVDELTREELFAIAAQVGLDAQKLEKDLQSSDIDTILNNNRLLARSLGINGTPTFIVNTSLQPGALNLQELKELVSHARTP